MKPLIIRTDASFDVGIGHVMRCLALAQAWRGKVVFLMSSSEIIAQRLRKEGMKIRYLLSQIGSQGDALETVAAAYACEAEWIVLDGYKFDTEYQKNLRLSLDARSVDNKPKFLFIDDMQNLDYYYADVVVNQSIFARRYWYKDRKESTKLLLGSKYVLIREAFLKEKKKVLITMGGGCSSKIVAKIMRALEQIDNLEVKYTPNSCIPECVDLMSWADMAISGAGHTCWELLYMGVPNVIITLSENQRKFAEEFIFMPIRTISLGWHEDVTENQIVNAVTYLLGERTIDGRGAQKVVEEMENYGD